MVSSDIFKGQKNMALFSLLMPDSEFPLQSHYTDKSDCSYFCAGVIKEADLNEKAMTEGRDTNIDKYSIHVSITIRCFFLPCIDIQFFLKKTFFF
jgi:hypothetical protein